MNGMNTLSSSQKEWYDTVALATLDTHTGRHNRPLRSLAWIQDCSFYSYIACCRR